MYMHGVIQQEVHVCLYTLNEPQTMQSSESHQKRGRFVQAHMYKKYATWASTNRAPTLYVGTSMYTVQM